MSQKIALVTGAMGGLGTAICQSLAKDGFKVVANCLPNFEQKDGWLSAQRDLGFDFVATSRVLRWSPRSRPMSVRSTFW